jgi:SAM-dependent methyltransferase
VYGEPALNGVSRHSSASMAAAAEAIERTRGLDRSSLAVLDLACGTGDGLQMLLEAGFRVAGIDVDGDMIRTCGERLAAIGDRRAELKHGDLTRLAWSNQSFDVVVSGGLPGDFTEEQIRDVKREIIRVLRMEGLFIGNIPSGAVGTEIVTVDEKSIRRFWAPFRVEATHVVEVAFAGEENCRPSLAVVARMLDFPTRFAAAFRLVESGGPPIASREALAGLRDRIVAALPALGYRPGDRPPKFLLVPRHKYEDRLIPLLVFQRRADAMPIVQYDACGGVITLWVYGPVQDDRTCPYSRFVIDCNPWLGPIDERTVRGGVRAFHREIAVGVHATERLLRTADLRHHRSVDLPVDVAVRLDTLVSQSCRRCDLLGPLFAVLQPFMLYTGHDCYDEAIDVDTALDTSMSFLLQPKGKAFQFYGSEDHAGRWSPSGDVFRSHLNQRFGREVQNRWNTLEPAFVADAHALMERRMQSLSALPYMRNVCCRDRDSDVSIGWRNFRDALQVPVYDPERSVDGQRVAWVMSLHSFSDEPFRWGMDQLWSLYDMFMVAARHIRAACPSDLIVLRPHPNSLGMFTDPGLIEQVEAGIVRHPTDLLDVYLQLRLCQDIAALGAECELSSLQPAEELLRPARSIVVTRHGSILIEAAWIDRLGIFSRIAPYAFLFSEERQYSDAESLRNAMLRARETVLAGAVPVPTRHDIAKYQAILDTPNGVKRATGMGEVEMPTVGHQPLRNFDDFRYGPETIEEAAVRLLSLFNVPIEKEALRSAFGWGDA